MNFDFQVQQSIMYMYMILSHDTNLAGTTQSSSLRIYTLYYTISPMVCWFSMYNPLKHAYPDLLIIFHFDLSDAVSKFWPHVYFSNIFYPTIIDFVWQDMGFTVIYVKYGWGGRRDGRLDGIDGVRQVKTWIESRLNTKGYTQRDERPRKSD